jgi:hypothetical protein
MKRLLLVVMLIISALVAGCVTYQKPEPSQKVLFNVKKIALIKYKEKTPVYFVDIGSKPGESFASGAIIGEILMGSMVNANLGEKSRKFTQEINTRLGAPDLEKDFQEALVRLLEKKDCEVRTITVSRDKSGEPILSEIPSGELDAIVDIAFIPGYFASGATTDYRRAMKGDLKVYSATDKKLIFSKPINLKAFTRKGQPPEFQYKDFDELMADPVAAFNGLKAWVTSVAVLVVANTLR